MHPLGDPRTGHGSSGLLVGLLLASMLVVGCREEREEARPAPRRDAVDFARLTPRSDLYVRSRRIPERFYETPGCTVAGAVPADGADSLRWVNHLTDEQLSDPGPPTWTPEPPGSPAAHGTYEVTRYPCRRPTPREVRAAQDLWDRSFEAAVARGWFDVAKAEADGYHIGHPGERIHYVHDAYMVDDGVLVPDAPEFLVVFESKAGERLLAGFMYMLPGFGDHGPQIGGPLTVWHYHIMDLHCWDRGLVVARPGADGACARGVASRRTPEMLHVWFFDRTHGPFASDMKPPKSLTAGPASTCHGLPIEGGAGACEDGAPH